MLQGPGICAVVTSEQQKQLRRHYTSVPLSLKGMFYLVQLLWMQMLTHSCVVSSQQGIHVMFVDTKAFTCVAAVSSM